MQVISTIVNKPNRFDFEHINSNRRGNIRVIRKGRASIHGYFVEGMLECLVEHQIEELIFRDWEDESFIGFKDWFHNLKRLNLNRLECKSFSGLEFCTNLTSFEYYDYPSVKASLNLCQFKQLESIKIVWPKKNNYPKIGYPVEVFQISSLKEVHVENYKGSFEVFSQPQIEKLVLRFCEFENLEKIEVAQNLVHLHIEGNKLLTSVAGVNELKNLKYLVIGNTKNLNQIPDIRKLKDLEHVSVGVADSSVVEVEPNLDWLDTMSKLDFLAYFYPVHDVSLEKLFCSKLTSITLCLRSDKTPSNKRIEELVTVVNKKIDGRVIRVKDGFYTVLSLHLKSLE